MGWVPGTIHCMRNKYYYWCILQSEGSNLDRFYLQCWKAQNLPHCIHCHITKRIEFLLMFNLALSLSLDWITRQNIFLLWGGRQCNDSLTWNGKKNNYYRWFEFWIIVKFSLKKDNFFLLLRFRSKMIGSQTFWCLKYF